MCSFWLMLVLLAFSFTSTQAQEVLKDNFKK